MSDHDVSLLDEAKQKHAEAVARMDEIKTRIMALPDDAPDDETEFLKASFEKEKNTAKRWAEHAERTEVTLAARQALKPQAADENGAKPQKIEVKEPLTYQRGGPHQYVTDQYLAQVKHDEAARERLNRHAAEMRVERRDLSTTAGAGGEMVAPIYLQDEWITLARAGRVTANLAQQRALPPGTNSLVIPKLSGGAATAIQASENSAVQETDPTTTSLTVGVKTIAGQVDLSRQLFDLSQPGMDEIIFADLAQDYATKLDIQVISGSGSSGQALGLLNVGSINSVTADDASPTVGEIYPKIADAWSRISTNLYRNADVIVMHPRRWAMFQGAVDSSGRPLASAEAPQNAISRGGAVVSEGLAGSIQGLPVYVDPNIPTNRGTNTNQDVILVLRASELLLYEGGLRQMTFESVGSNTLTVRLQVFGYFAFASGRYAAAISKIEGTALVPPTF